MRKFLLAAAGAALTIAAPASAQYYGYAGNQHSSIETRLQNVMGSINSAPYYEQNQLRGEAINLHRQVRYAAQRGIDPWSVIGNRLEQLEVEVNQAVHHGGYGQNNGYYGYNGNRHGHHGRGGDEGDRG